MQTRNGVNCRLSPAFIALAALGPVIAHAQQSYPAQPIKVMVAAGAGGFADAVARVVSEALSPRIGQTIVIENRGGAGGNIAARAVAQSAPDGCGQPQARRRYSRRTDAG